MNESIALTRKFYSYKFHIKLVYIWKNTKKLSFRIKHITDKKCFVFIIPTLIHNTKVKASCWCHNDQILLKTQVDTISKTSFTKSPPSSTNLHCFDSSLIHPSLPGVVAPMNSFYRLLHRSFPFPLPNNCNWFMICFVMTFPLTFTLICIISICSLIIIRLGCKLLSSYWVITAYSVNYCHLGSNGGYWPLWYYCILESN